MCSQPRPTLRQRLFARFMAGQDAESFERYRDRKEKLLGDLEGSVLEIGPGTGVNLQFYRDGVHWIGIEPNPAMHTDLGEKAAALGLDIEIVDSTLEDSRIEENSVDAVVSTLVLCSVPDVAGLLSGIRRVLRPGGQFVFLEHVVDRPWTLRRLIQRAAPYTPWRYFSDGCNPGRDIGSQIRAAGFAQVNLESYMETGTGIIRVVTRPHIAGVAVK